MDKILSPVKGRILKYLEINGIPRESFYHDTGISASNFKGPGLKSELGGDKIARILAVYPDLDSRWLLTGEGAMLCPAAAAGRGPAGEPAATTVAADAAGSESVADQAAAGNAARRKVVPPRIPSSKSKSPVAYAAGGESLAANVADVAAAFGERAVPLYRFDPAAGLSGFFARHPDRRAERSILLPDLPPCDGAVRIVGDAMAPLLRSGDLVLYKIVRNLPADLLLGEMYLLSFEANGEEITVLRYVERGRKEGYVRLVCHSPNYAAKEIPVASLRAAALVRASVRYNTMG